jgi:hypothetical protein
MKKTYTAEEAEYIFKEGFAKGFTQGKTRNIITAKYYIEAINEATKNWKITHENKKEINE